MLDISWLRRSMASIAPLIMRRMVATSFSANPVRSAEYLAFISDISL